MLDFTIRGVLETKRTLRSIAGNLPGIAQKATREEVTAVELKDAQTLTPVRTGKLRGTGRVVDLPGGRMGVKLVFGGQGVDYAAIVHENLQVFHPNGQAKFAETAVLRNMPTLVNRVAKRMSKSFK